MTLHADIPPGPTLTAALDGFARQFPARPAAIDRCLPVSYALVARDSRRLAAWLAGQGLGPGDTVGITIAEDLPQLLVSLALLRLGCRQVSLPRRDPAPMRAALAQRLGVVAIVGEAAGDAIDGTSLLLPDPGGIVADTALDGAPLPSVPPGGGMLLFGSSGTTGAPKLMAVTEGMILAQGQLLAPYGAVFHRQLPADTNHGKRLQLRSIGTGGTEVFGNSIGEDGLGGLCARFGVQRAHLSPLRAEVLIVAEGARAGAALPATTRLFTTGGRVAPELRVRLTAAIPGGLYIHYGTTETGSISLALPADHAAEPETVGRAFPGVTVAVVDEAGRAVPQGELGLMRIRSPGAIAGYLDDVEATRRAFRDGWFQPGDVGRITASGLIVLAGRNDEMMNLGAIKIFPAEIEAAAAGFPGLLDCAAFARTLPGLGEVPLLAAVAGAGFDATALLAQCRARLGPRAPRKVVVVDTLPRNAQGKVLRRDLAAGAA